MGRSGAGPSRGTTWHEWRARLLQFRPDIRHDVATLDRLRQTEHRAPCFTTGGGHPGALSPDPVARARLLTNALLVEDAKLESYPTWTMPATLPYTGPALLPPGPPGQLGPKQVADMTEMLGRCAGSPLAWRR